MPLRAAKWISRRGNEIGVGSVQMGGNVSEDTREKYLKIALVVFGVIFLLIYPLGLIWPSGCCPSYS